jgi:hypothetical protein
VCALLAGLIIVFGLCLAFAPRTPTGRALAAGTSISLTGNGVAYTQDFNTLATSGASSLLPVGWAMSETGTNANTTYTAGTGSNNAGDTYSFGSSGSSDRAFGGVQSGSLVPTIGACFTNNTGVTITSLAIAYTGEQWRLGASGRGADRLDFQLSTNATALNNGTWTDYDALDFSSPVTSGSVAALDGNSSANRTPLNFVISGLNIASGQTFFIRWLDFNVTNADDGLSIDDFTLMPNGDGNGGGPRGVGAANPSTVNPGGSTLLTVQVLSSANAPSKNLRMTAEVIVAADLTAIGGLANQSFYDDGTHGDATAGDNTFSFQATVAATTSTGNKSLPVTITDVQAGTGSTSIALAVVAPEGSCARCGVERWSVKTATDADAALVDAAHPTPTTIATMRSWPAQSNIPTNNRIAPYETTAWTIEATLTLYKKEDDSDYHLVLRDAAGNTLVGEIPCPGCVGASSPVISRINNARATFNATLTATTSFQTANIPVRVTGIAMFDFPHGQTGAAPNQIELHPITDLVFNPTCTYALSDINPFFDVSAHQSVINLNVSGACAWAATSNANWITIGSAEPGYGNGSVSYMVSENTTLSARQGTITVAGQTVTVVQDGGLGDNCETIITPQSQTVGSAGGSVTIAIESSHRCAWQTKTDVPWVTITTNPNGTGNGAVTLAVAANTSFRGRVGAVRIGNQSFAVKQKGQ